MNRRSFLTAAVAAGAALAVAPAATALTVQTAVPTLPEFVLNAKWGTYGKHGVTHCNGTCPQHRLRWVRLVDCETSHLLAILAKVSSDERRIIDSILEDRVAAGEADADVLSI